MKAHAAFVFTALLALLAIALSAQAPQKPEAPKSEIQTRAEALMERARHLSDIRAKNAPAYRLKATFSFMGKNLENLQGTYTEVWVSDSQWRRETVVSNFSPRRGRHTKQDLETRQLQQLSGGGHPAPRASEHRRRFVQAPAGSQRNRPVPGNIDISCPDS
jgi:hypothetical protein